MDRQMEMCEKQENHKIRFPMWRVPDRLVFSGVHQCIAEFGPVFIKTCERGCSTISDAQYVEMEEQVVTRSDRKSTD